MLTTWFSPKESLNLCLLVFLEIEHLVSHDLQISMDRNKADLFDKTAKLACQVRTQRTEGGTHTFVLSFSRLLRLFCATSQPPDAVGHLRAPPESRPLSGLKIAVSCRCRARPLSSCCKSCCSTPVRLGSA